MWDLLAISERKVYKELVRINCIFEPLHFSSLICLCIILFVYEQCLAYCLFLIKDNQCHVYRAYILKNGANPSSKYEICPPKYPIAHHICWNVIICWGIDHLLTFLSLLQGSYGLSTFITSEKSLSMIAVCLEIT